VTDGIEETLLKAARLQAKEVNVIGESTAMQCIKGVADGAC
jgi:hypothetical protein